jgi:hypothetical protein
MITLFGMTFFCIQEQNVSLLVQNKLANPRLRKIGLPFKSEEKYYDIKVLRNFHNFLDASKNLALNMPTIPTVKHLL